MSGESSRPKRPGSDYIDRTIATVRNHRDSENSWPQWANILADEIEALREELQLAEAHDDYFTLARKFASSQETVRVAFKELGQLRNALLRWCTAFPAEIDDTDRELISDELEAIFEEEDEL
jgi:hypothetical protein